MNFVMRYKKFSTKFTHEQRKKMLDFAMILGWKIKNNYENVVEEFCNEIAVKRHVFNVWMYKNKHTMEKRINWLMNVLINWKNKRNVFNVLVTICNPIIFSNDECSG